MNVRDAVAHISLAADATDDPAKRLGHLVAATEVLKVAITETKKKLAETSPAQGTLELNGKRDVDEVGTEPLPGMDVTVAGNGLVTTEADRVPFSDTLPDAEEELVGQSA